MPPVDNVEALKIFEKMNPILEKHLGTDVFVPDGIKEIPRVPSGLTFLDAICGGGLPVGAICEFYGPESTGKSTLCVQIAAFNQARDPNFRVLILDFEQTMTTKYLAQIGLKTEKPSTFLLQPSTIEMGALICKLFMQYGLVDCIIWDTPAASLPASQMAPLSDRELREGFRDIEKGEVKMPIGLHARVFSHAIAALVPQIKQQNVLFLVPNQTRTTINTWGAGETTPGGKALKFYASIRCRITRKQQIKESVVDPYFATKKATNIANLIGFTIVKNKTAPPAGECDIPIVFGKGFQDKQAVFDLAVKRGIIAKAGGGNFTLPGDTSIRGTENVMDHFDKNPDDWKKILEALGTPQWDDKDLVDETAVVVTDDGETLNSEVAEGEATELLQELEEGKVRI